MLEHVEYAGVKVYNSKQVRGLLNVEFDLILHLFQENKETFFEGEDYFHIARDEFEKISGDPIGGRSKYIFAWTSEGIEKIKSALDKSRERTIRAIDLSRSANHDYEEVRELKLFVSPGGLSVREVVTALRAYHMIDFGQNTLYRKLRNRGVFNSFNIPYSNYIEDGSFGVEMLSDGGRAYRCKVYANGIRNIVKWFGEDVDRPGY